MIVSKKENTDAVVPNILPVSGVSSQTQLLDDQVLRSSVYGYLEIEPPRIIEQSYN